MTEWVLSGPKETSEMLVHDNAGRSRPHVIIYKSPAPERRNPHRAKIVRGNWAILCLSSRRIAARDPEKDVYAPIHRQTRNSRGREYAGHGSETIQYAALKFPSCVRSPIFLRS